MMVHLSLYLSILITSQLTPSDHAQKSNKVDCFLQTFLYGYVLSKKVRMVELVSALKLVFSILVMHLIFSLRYFFVVYFKSL